MVDDSSIPAPLTSEPGDPARGRDLDVKRKLGNCLACHVMPIPEQSFHGETGPDLNGVGGRYTAAELRLQIVDSKAEAAQLVIHLGLIGVALYQDVPEAERPEARERLLDAMVRFTMGGLPALTRERPTSRTRATAEPVQE